MATPKNIKALLADSVLEIHWDDEEISRLPFRQMRGLCPCASCVNELTGERMFFAEQAAEDIKPLKMDLIGNYAVRISWSDGHHTGLFTWEYLKQMGRALA